MRTDTARNSMLLALVAAVTLLVGGIGLALWREQYLDQQDLLLKPHLDTLRTSYADTLEMFRLAASAEVHSQMDRPEILALITHALDSGTTDLTPLQNRLRNALTQTYQRIQDWGGDRLQINLADGRILLSIHQPAAPEGQQMAASPSPRLTPVEKRTVDGLEVGRDGVSYRCVFPLT
ncbi:MAG: hypothetical protein B7X42_05765, partial [Thiomonas sp. 14-66-4]